MNTSSKQEQPASRSAPVRLQGIIKNYRDKDGYGFIASGQTEYYFNVHGFNGDVIPQAGMKCEFTPRAPRKGAKSPVAVNVTITDQNVPQRPGDERVKCPSCGKLVVPRLYFMQNGNPKNSFCPYCGAEIKKFALTKRFIATAVYGDRLDPEVIAPRRFRDEALLPHAWGQRCVRIYYRISPPLAAFITRHPAEGRVLKPLLDRIASIYG